MEGLLVEPRGTITVREGDPLKIICTLPSKQDAYIVWQTPYGDTFQQATTSIVDIASVEKKHSGQYTCSADNKYTERVEVIGEWSCLLLLCVFEGFNSNCKVLIFFDVLTVNLS